MSKILNRDFEDEVGQSIAEAIQDITEDYPPTEMIPGLCLIIRHQASLTPNPSQALDEAVSLLD